MEKHKRLVMGQTMEMSRTEKKKRDEKNDGIFKKAENWRWEKRRKKKKNRKL
jgi:hypothetical protein